MNLGGSARPKILAKDYGLPMACPQADCGFRWLKLPGIKMKPCPNCGSTLISTRPRKKRV